MNAFWKHIPMAALVIGFAASPAAAYAAKICDAKGENCFELVCLKDDTDHTLKPVPEIDSELCLKAKTNARIGGTSSRQAVLAKVDADCKRAGGVVQDKGTQVLCVFGSGKQPANAVWKPPVPSPTNPNEPGLIKVVKPCPNGQEPPCGDRTSPIPVPLK